MTETSVSLADNLNANLRSHNRVTVAQVSGRWLVAARALWISLAAVTIGFLVAGIPLRYNQYTEICSGEECEYLQLSPVEADALQSISLSPGSYALYAGTLEVITAFTFVMVGLLIFWRRSQEWIALLVSLWLITFGTADVLIAVKEQHLLWNQVVDFLDNLGWVFLLPLFLFLFPDGRFVPRWTRWIIAALAGGMILLAIFEPAQTDPDTPNDLPAMILWFSIQLTGIGAQIYRYRRVSSPVQRQQTRWVVLGLVAVVLLITLVVVLGQVDLPANRPGQEELLDKLIEITLINLAFVIIPLTIGISILRYRLWDIDIIINRTLVYGSLTALVVAIYVLIVGSLGALFQTSGNLFFSLLATGAVAVLFQPLRERLQRTINRLMFGERDDPVTVLSHLSQRLEATIASDAVLPVIVETVAQALKLPFAAIEVPGGQTATVYGQPLSETVRFPLVHQAETIGQLVVAPRAPGEAFTPADRRLLENIAHRAGAAVHAVRLTTDLQRSRERLVTTREEERRRLRRDLHDGLGPALATLSLQTEAARDLVHGDPYKSEALMNEVIAGMQAAITDIRRLVYGLRPPALDDLGLVSALKEQASQYSGNGLHITVEAPEHLHALPAAVEVAVYRIVQEALTNVVRHARAQTCVVRLKFNDGVELEICDDGQGIPKAHRAGVGLNSMHERAAEVGGQCQIASTPGMGTQIHVTLPARLGESHGQR